MDDLVKWLAIQRMIAERIRILSDNHAPYCPCLVPSYDLKQIANELDASIAGIEKAI